MTRALRKTIADLLTAQKLGILATLGTAYPYQNIVAFAASGDLKNILFATKRSTSKYKNLKSRKRVAIFIDDRSNREMDFQQTTGVTALGGARELRGRGREKFAKLFLRKHPSLREFLSASDCALFSIQVRAYYAVLHFQDVVEVRMT
ncbi:MAG: pyridoxamine 5'-phosphate oxidase family protein [Candidatus Aminicenantes bacterium]|nr:pyridoxamine 5'-phosphate oxidase family protein [Candidatus Aminicenantes bacterium]